MVLVDCSAAENDGNTKRWEPEEESVDMQHLAVVPHGVTSDASS